MIECFLTNAEGRENTIRVSRGLEIDIDYCEPEKIFILLEIDYCEPEKIFILLEIDYCEPEKIFIL